MLRVSGIALLLAGLIAFAGVATAQQDKEVTLKGTITCAKCDLKKETKCATVIVVKEKVKDKDAEVIYYFDKNGHTKYHGDTCTEAKAGSVTGVVTKKDDKSTITVSKVEYK